MPTAHTDRSHLSRVTTKRHAGGVPTPAKPKKLTPGEACERWMRQPWNTRPLAQALKEAAA